ncbi:MAG: hypothetical protein R2751_19595 [Bacteroidales bacterium]
MVLPNFGDELGVVNTIRLSGLDVPVLVQACDDDNDRVDVKSRAMPSGKLVCNNLYQYGIKFTNTSTHTYALDDPEFERDVRKFAAVCRVVKGSKNLRVGPPVPGPSGSRPCDSAKRSCRRTASPWCRWTCRRSWRRPKTGTRTMRRCSRCRTSRPTAPATSCTRDRSAGRPASDWPWNGGSRRTTCRSRPSSAGSPSKRTTGAPPASP